MKQSNKHARLESATFMQRDARYWTRFLREEIRLLKYSEIEDKFLFEWGIDTLAQDEEDFLRIAAAALNLEVKGRAIFLAS